VEQAMSKHESAKPVVLQGPSKITIAGPSFPSVEGINLHFATSVPNYRQYKPSTFLKLALLLFKGYLLFHYARVQRVALTMMFDLTIANNVLTMYVSLSC